MADYDELINLLKHLLLDRFMPKPDYVRGVLGDGAGVVQVPGRPDYAYARFSRGAAESFEIFNKQAPMVDGWPVLIGEYAWQPGLTQVVGTDWAAYEQSSWGDSVSTSNPHAPTHEWRDNFIGADPLSIYLRAIAPGRGYSTSATGTVVFVNSFEYHTGTIWPGTPGVDLAPVMSVTATGTARFAGIYVSQSNTLGIVTGTTTVDSPVIEPNLVTFPFGTIPIARVRIYGGQAGIRESDFRDARQLFDFPPLVAASQAEVDAGVVDYKAVTPARLFNSTAVDRPIKVKNTSGATASANDVGYIVYTSGAGPEYKTTTTANDPAACLSIAVVISGGANNADIYVQTRGRVTGKYTGTAPSAGSLLFFSTTAGQLTIGSTMRPELAAIAQAAGSGGLVEMLLYPNRKTQKVSPSQDVFRVNSSSVANFTATIAAKSGANVEYTITAGTNENSIVPASASELAKRVLHNTTRGDTALIDSVNTANTGTPADGTITLTATAPAAWAVSDAITCKSQINTTALSGGAFFYEYDLSSADNTVIPALATRFNAYFVVIDTSAVTSFYHPYESHSDAKALGFLGGDRPVFPVMIISNRFLVSGEASGAGTLTYLMRVVDVEVAAP